MLRTLIRSGPRVLSATEVLLARPSKVEKPDGATKFDPEAAPAIETVEEAQVASATSDPHRKTDESATHVRPQTILKDILHSVSAGQQAFLFGTHKDASDPADGVLRATGTFFESVNTAYEGRMLQERQIEVEKYVEKRRLHYAQRLDEETEEFRQEQKEVHEEIQRMESEKYKRELNNDVVQFTKARETEYEVRLYADVEKYYNALLAYQSRSKKQVKAKSADDNLSMQLNMNLQAIINEMELEDSIRDFGDATGSGNDITDQDIRSYVVQCTCFYEKCAQDEIHDFTERRRTFYEDLLEARAIRHAAKIRSDTEKYRRERQTYYDDRLTSDGSWMTHCFQEHYNRCFLQAYSRRAWIDHRRYQATQEGIKIFTKEGERIPAISDPATISVAALSAEIPLAQILDVYESENMAEITRDVFLKAARRVANASDHSRGSDSSS
ncbi:hypothetical protein ABB37_09937 [Leptomonas pyrrhocoris]|uniref:Uncharacterized protein n=1 Tax=Leptomonas pyrrhocoris TaxID=157538 RepID=A0A0N0DQR4_LEPPY|nr:hypothetical protein ABB37_09937 [Leptomonas pyrrhocoris]XP_015651831.1 hypothetical protein ABB37_09937 [Leptomonas pyrrhocoris]XP_015651832.1 hypothetical protein ABB37_09937 [Leptomonas pyrrhocoris]XP_015651833.1 hypothetical protein ABB37_09937 [Leptomonas pyrrhocoris]XP_015651834.1 hypothetical protein ABB37_09937 [Leptomonas pyrrhocoris]KPA73391.1 hypothetical protein ABB37_09937 [Leptomonas pyrrhocoris]KPA73392.1 hypothetical protein ABB37_09937 [Leptomonas pyrrhocoris]KPA73393.1 h|eukprot:XP_015651830.1 hypothetical protein ABB37_09937 [Leptomonas pyrrhocoris]